MSTGHIDDVTLGLYAAGYSGLRDDLVDFVERHLSGCTHCKKKLESEKKRQVADCSVPVHVQLGWSESRLLSPSKQSEHQNDLVRIDDDNHSSGDPRGSLTQILDAIDEDESARAKLWSIVYDELVSMAKRSLGREPNDEEIAAEDLVHETYLKMFSNRPSAWQNRRHFFAAAAQAMRSILVNDARSRRRLKRGGTPDPHVLDKKPSFVATDPNDTLAVHEALTKLESIDSRKAHIVKLRYFAGLTLEEAAKQLGISSRTADTDWSFARAWLYQELKGRSEPASSKKQVMRPDIAPQIQRLFEHARHMSPVARKKFLTEACGDNQDLYYSVVSLLEHSSE